MAHVLRKLGLLIWKNFVLQIRRPIGTCIEILLPVVFLALLILARVNIEDKNECMSNFDDFYFNAPFNIRELQKERKTNNRPHLAYYPLDNKVVDLLTEVADNVNLTLTDKKPDGTTFTSLDDLIDTVKENDDYYVAAVIFDNIEAGKPLPKKIKYSIRMHHSTPRLLKDTDRDTWRTKIVYPLFQGTGPSERDIYSKIFVPIQKGVDRRILEEHTSNTSVKTQVRQMPYPNYREDIFIVIIQSTMPLVFNLAFIYTAVMVVKELVAEKQYRLKESMKMMGLSNWMHWTAWFIKVMGFFLIIIILQTILLKVGKIFEYTDGGVTFVFLLLYTLSSTFTLFFLSTIFSNAIRGMLFTAVLWFATLAPYLSFSSEEAYENLDRGSKVGSCLLPNSCLGIMVQIISQKESSQIGMNWDNVNKPPSVDDNFTLADCFGILIFDCFLYGFLTWYIENVFPGEFGIPKPPWFFLMPSYWCGKSVNRDGSVNDLNMNKTRGPNFEEEPEGVQVGVSIQDLRKVYKGARGKKVAVDSLSLDIYKGQITALLGHNGAGKTTTMSILTGLFPPTAGNAFVNGNSILTNMDAVRESLGLCPQHNVLFDRLTVKEHLKFFTALKGISKKKAMPEINQMIKDIQLSDKADQQANTLSGGMKRKLNCAIALIGGSETIFLDEPTSGMDPYARRATWDLLQKYRANKTIILTTHFMDEADYLGDRIAIMADGELRCCGSSLFLKKRYGVGYHMTIVKGPEFNENETCSLVAQNIPSAKMVGNLGAEMSYILEESSTPLFKGLFEQLEDNKDSFGITSFGVSVTTLEEVFLKVGEGETLTGVEEVDEHHDKKPLAIERQESKIERAALLTGVPLFFSQFTAMFIKRLLNTKRQKVAIITQVILPCFLVLCGLLLMASLDTQADDPPRLFTLSMMKEKDISLQTFFGDFRSSRVGDLKTFANQYYSSVDTTMNDITSDVNKIEAENQNIGISLLFTSPSLDLNNTELQNCCKYKYLVLNQKCKDHFTNSTNNLIKLCGSEPKDFGYSYCMDCALPGNSSKCGGSKTRTIPATDLTKSATYFEEYVLEDAGKNDESYFNERVAGFSMHDSSARVWYTPQSWHGLPSALTAGTNILLKYYTNDSEYGVETTNYPLPKNANEKTSIVSNRNIMPLVNFCTMAASFIAASFITFLVDEKTSKAKHIQFVSGVSSLCYWLATFCWDFINFLVPALLILILFAAFNLDEFDGELGYIFLVLLLFACSMLPFIYMFSFVFTSSMIAYSVVALIMMVISLAMVIAVFILDATDEEAIGDTLNNIFLLIPSYAFPQALRDISTNKIRRDSCKKNAQTLAKCILSNVKYQEDTLDMTEPGIGKHCLYMFIECIVYFIITILIEENFFISRLCGGRRSTTYSINAREDIDVQEERKKVHNMSQDDIKKSAVVVKNLTKVYRTTGMMAVDHLSYEVAKKQCFGLLGVNGAGKTTTFGMLTGELGITNGTAYLDGFNIQSNLKDVQQRIGYCPQFDALIGKMTGSEMLRMFARLRGVPAHKLDEVVENAIAQLNLAKWSEKMCGDYSGGNKRKLSTAIALVGDPAIVFLDEPTSGMDPASRRFLWDTLSGVLNSGRSIVLTSHSMEECEALCTKLVIMVNGQLKCIGSIQHLKSRFGKGYTLIMKIGSTDVSNQNANGSLAAKEKENPDTIYNANGVNGTTNPAYSAENGAVQLSVPKSGLPRVPSVQCLCDNTNRVKTFIQEQFPDSYLVEERQGYLQYQINNQNLRWSQIFGTLEEQAKNLGVVDYSVSQTSLEQVFINFAKEQHAEERNFNKGCCSCSCF